MGHDDTLRDDNSRQPAPDRLQHDYPLKAVFRDGQLYFVGAENDWFFGDTGFCPDIVSARGESGRIVWQIETEKFIHPCDLFPLRFGSQPNDWKTVVPAAPLKSGELYIVSGEGGDMYHGAFRYEETRLRRVENDPEIAMDYPPYYGLEWGEQK